MKQINLAKPQQVNSRDELLTILRANGLTDLMVEECAGCYQEWPNTVYVIPPWLVKRILIAKVPPSEIDAETQRQNTLMAVSTGTFHVAVKKLEPIFWMPEGIHRQFKQVIEERKGKEDG